MRNLLNYPTLLSIALILSSCSSTEPIKTWDIREFGAVSSKEKTNTTAIQSAIDACNSAGGGEVHIRDGIYISGTILLKDNVTLNIHESAQLLGSSNPADYLSIDTFVDATGQERGNCLIGAIGASNIAIIGSGTIDGNGSSFRSENLSKTFDRLETPPERRKTLSANRPFLLRFVRSQSIRIENINLRQPAAWTCHFFQCDGIDVDGVTIYSHAHQNNDGIDLDSSSNARIQNCDIDAGDDAICVKSTSPVPTKNIFVRNCRLKSDWGTIKFGTESMGDFENITIEDCIIHDTKGGGIKILSVDGANIRNIRIRNIQMQDVDMPIFIRLGERRRTYRGAPQQVVGSIDDIEISGITATTRSLEQSRVSPSSGILITGTPNHPIGRVLLEDISITLAGGGSTEHQNVIVEEAETKYPEFSFFGVLPSHGLFARHIRELDTRNLHFKLTSPDARPEQIINGNVQ